jgi:hypothetical protein
LVRRAQRKDTKAKLPANCTVVPLALKPEYGESFSNHSSFLRAPSVPWWFFIFIRIYGPSLDFSPDELMPAIFQHPVKRGLLSAGSPCHRTFGPRTFPCPGLSPSAPQAAAFHSWPRSVGGAKKNRPQKRGRHGGHTKPADQAAGPGYRAVRRLWFRLQDLNHRPVKTTAGRG